MTSEEMTNDMATVLGLPKYLVRDFMELLTKVILHITAEKALDSPVLLGGVEVCIPFIGTLECDGDMVSIVLEKDFRKGLEKAIRTGESKLLTDISQRTVEMMKERYRKIDW